jgi:hypothetical protein
MNELVAESWFTQLVEDCKNIIVEREFAARWELIEGYHSLGKRILDEYPNFERAQIYGEEIASRVSESLGRAERTVERAIQFAKMYPDLNLLPEGKDTSWHRICNKYLPKPSEKQKEDYLPCKSCGSEIMPIVIKCGHCGQEFEITREMIKKR